VKLVHTGLMLRGDVIIMMWWGLLLISEFPPCGLRRDFWWRALSVFLVQEIVIKVLYLPLEVIIFLLLNKVFYLYAKLYPNFPYPFMRLSTILASIGADWST
jgi:hypothetical protein